MVEESPLILEYLFCCQFATEDHIIDLLEDLATKATKCPITQNLESYGTNYHKLYVDILEYYKMKTVKKSTKINVIKNWSSIRKKTLKDLVLKNFIIEVKSNYKFDEITTKNLKRELTIALNFKNVNDKNIIMENNKISKILGLNIGINTYNWDL
jgi:membrane-associated HD superfamily phosphohydrolase